MNHVQKISAQDLFKLSQQGPVEVIDVRTPAEFREVHASIARNVPLDSLDPQAILAHNQRAPETPLYVLCKSGGRSKNACDKLVRAGCGNLVEVEGGTNAWEQAGLPVVRGKKMMSLERQVRTAAGCIILVSGILGFYYPLFIGVCAAMGAGLMFAGITGSCAMGMIMAKMPWNQVKVDSPQAGTQNSCGSTASDESCAAA
jgi:rhodanese-related sulfurtransferase